MTAFGKFCLSSNNIKKIYPTLPYRPQYNFMLCDFDRYVLVLQYLHPRRVHVYTYAQYI